MSPPTDETLVRVDREEDLLFITLDDPGRANALSIPILDRLTDLYRRDWLSDGVRAVLLGAEDRPRPNRLRTADVNTLGLFDAVDEDVQIVVVELAVGLGSVQGELATRGDRADVVSGVAGFDDDIRSSAAVVAKGELDDATFALHAVLCGQSIRGKCDSE